MGTMFDIVVYHASREDAKRAIDKAVDEIYRLDRVLSDFDRESDLSKLVRDGRRGEVQVDPSLYEVIAESLTFSRRSGGRFDVTIAPLLKTWRQAREDGRSPSAAELADARQCVGYEKIEMRPPDRIRLRSDCLEIDLGGIGKGYAVDRALGVLKAAGIRNAMINAGASSIASMGSAPDHEGWPIRLNAPVSGRQTLLLRNRSISTSEQSPSGHIVDPRTGAPSESRLVVSVVAPTATVSDALSTTVLLMPMEEAKQVLAQFADVSALWMTSTGELKAAFGESRLHLSDSR
jgi:thiamine biosynthesis lipoprotein